MHKALNYMSLARRGGRIELGEEPCGGAARAGHARLIIVAADASPHTWRRAKSYAAGTDQQCLRVPFSKDEMGEAIGRSSLAMAAFTDPARPGLCQTLEQREEYREVLENLENKTKRLKQRQDEAKAHQRNVRMGKVRRAPGPKKD